MKKIASTFLLLFGLTVSSLAFSQTLPSEGGGTTPGEDNPPTVSVPEPGVLLLLASGVAGLGVARYLKRNKG